MDGWMEWALNGTADRISELLCWSCLLFYMQWVYLCGLPFVHRYHLLPFYKRVELKDRERFPESKPTKEKPFRMISDNTVITVKLTSLEAGWELDKTNHTQV